MKSNRTTIVFFIIVGLAVCVVLAGIIYRVLPELIASPGGTPPTAATPLPRGAVAIEIHSSNTKEHWLDEVVAD